ncbi:unnamed protein product [Polarella glacialis]|uniref:Uncharacterized protein n=1 Tax=Polarella glacialis TaxID=89957 RepID=A0A813F3W2_POLGL|nr:unnamed protein product [Polarella glacialis]|mmetsp:Transcript_77662/g.140163  ORF Transcript_77662/g.140163 Transcript_77662/m.140163 type:complete len:130 (+) Transcript_77662:277-666(+)
MHYRTELEVTSKLKAMGINVLDNSHGLPVDRTLPFCELGSSSTSVPVYKVWYSLSPARSISVEFNAKRNQVSLRGARGFIISHLRIYLQYFGKIIDVSAQKAVGGKPAAGRVTKPGRKQQDKGTPGSDK